MQCANCGAELASGMAFCTNCGVPVAKDEPAQGHFCVQCGAELQPGNAFCIQCGTPVGAGQKAPVQAAAAGIHPSAASAVSEDPTQVIAANTQPMPQAQAAVPVASQVQPAVAVAPQTQTAVPAQPTASTAPSQSNRSGKIIGVIAGALALAAALGVGAFFVVQNMNSTSQAPSNSASSAAAVSTSAPEQASADAQASSATNDAAATAEVSSAQASESKSSSAAATSSDAPAQPATVTAKATVPTFTGMSERDAKSAIEAAGMKLGDIQYEVSDTVEKDQVISQKPEAGSEVDPRDVVTLVVSKGNPVHRYEFVSGSYTWSDAQSAAEGWGGYLACVSSEDEWARVLEVLPADGTFVVWIGGQRDSASNFTWVNGDTFEYSQWADKEPNNDGGTEDKLCLLKVNGTWGWYDTPNDVSSFYEASKMGFVVEYEE